MAQSQIRARRYDEALDAIAAAASLLRETNENGAWSDLYRIEGDVLLARGDEHGARAFTDAERCFTRALDIARAQQAKSWELRAATSLARLYGLQGRPAAAVQLIMPAIEWFTEGHDTADLKAARTIVRTLSVQVT